MARYDSGAEIVPYSQTRAQDFEPWSLETLVEAMRMECAGAPIEEIADALGLNAADVREHLTPSELRPSPRPERGHVGFAHLKAR